jgi:hypothetical protein
MYICSQICLLTIMNHLLLHCVFSFAMWGYVFCLFGVNWVLPHTVFDLMVGWRNWLGKRSSTMWNVVLLCLMWLLWRELNSLTEDVEVLEVQFRLLFLRLLCEWSTVLGITDSCNFTEFASSISFNCNSFL